MLRKGLFVLVAAVIGAGCVWLGDYGTRALERMLIDRTEHGLTVFELDLAYMHADGLCLELHGHAPDVFARDLALESARSTPPLAVIIDHTTVSLAPPPHRAMVRVELLRDSNGLTLTGRFHGEPMRDSVIAALGTAAPGLIVDDLTRVNAARPDRWGPELEMATLAATRIPNAYVIVEPGAVQVRELVRDAAHRREVSAALLALAGDGVRLDLRLREPLQVAARFAFAAVKGEAGAVRLEACAARTSDSARLAEMAERLHQAYLAREEAAVVRQRAELRLAERETEAAEQIAAMQARLDGAVEGREAALAAELAEARRELETLDGGLRGARQWIIDLETELETLRDGR